MNKLIKRLGYLIVAIVSIAAIGIVLNNKQASKAADFPQNTASINNGSVSRGGRLANNVGSIFLDPLQRTSLPKLQIKSKITTKDGSNILSSGEIVKNGDFSLTAEGHYNPTQSWVHLEWDTVPDRTDGYVVQKTTNPTIPSDDTSWDIAPTNYGKHIKILNVYPEAPREGNYLKSWMDQLDPNTGQPVSMGLIDVTPVSLSQFNANPDGYLKDSTGSYKYDGLFFGSSDYNGSLEQDINVAAQQATASFGNTGRSLIFGHDTVLGNAGWSHPNFHKFSSDLGVILDTDILVAGGSYENDMYLSNRVKFSTYGPLGIYPYKLDPNAIYDITWSHTAGQYLLSTGGATRWMQFTQSTTSPTLNPPGYAYDSSHKIIGDNNWYLITRNNYAMIQTGHTTGGCTPDEAKIITNMVYYTSTLTLSSPGDDHTVNDITPPDVPTSVVTKTGDNSINVNFNTKDNPTNYFYRIKAKTSSTTKYSDVVKLPILSGFKGYVYSLDDNPTGAPKVNKNPITGEVTNINLNPTSATDNHANLTFNRNPDAGKYLHIVAVDNSNNVSAVKTVSLSDYLWWKYESGTLTIYPHVLNANVDAEVTSPDPNDQYDDIVKWPWDQYLTQINTVEIKQGVKGYHSIEHLFYGQTNLKNIIGLTNLTTTGVYNMSGMFNGCANLESVDLSSFDTTSVANMFRFFLNCKKLKNIVYGPNFKTGTVLTFGAMFSHCTSLTDFSAVEHFDTRSGTSFDSMFMDCPGLTHLDLSGYSTNNVELMRWMFFEDHNLESINLNGWQTPKLKQTESMFNECFNLKKLSLSSFDVSSVTNFQWMFASCNSLTTLDLQNFNIQPTANTNGILKSMPKLWQLTLGNGTRIGANSLLNDPTPGTAITDLDNPSPVYYATNPQWREALTPTTIHAPTGAARTAAQIASDSLTRNDVRTYVWDQVGTQTLAVTPGNIDLGTHAGYLKNKEYTSSAQNINVTDNRNVRTGKRWHVEAAVTKPFKHTTDSTKVIRGNPLYYHNTTTGTTTHLLPTAQTLYSETATINYQDVKNYPWTLSFKASPSDIPKAGTYNATVTFTLINDTP
ncbi:BspA family leucine-rich repeat surface protein [Xylocopilactobacillus apis]|uniref:Surface protein n=1 Tax=Xylocopilactobacillus apis TaxID=2932183 RepID=A0AAU9CWV3_9LACO|nr:BspA family leucine-rich repeat surface protein [Xylocopilactobacillus apis]BDR56916.1 hypothetical protein KIMC2_14780 [Xylocopilactobacillus apis]